MPMPTNKQSSAESNHPSFQISIGVYEIQIKGLLDDRWREWFDGMTLEHVENGETGQEYTIISGPIADQPALHGLLEKIRDLNLTLISLKKIDPNEENQR
jgi:hypothetical protein